MSVPYSVISKFPYTPEAENASDDLAFSAGQSITVTEEVDDEWLFGTYKAGGELLSGYFPKAFVEKEPDTEPIDRQPQSPVEPKSSSSAGPAEIAETPKKSIESVAKQPEESPKESPKESLVEQSSGSDFKHKLQSFNVTSAPPLPGQTVADTDFTKKPFIAASPHSSYVPAVERRESKHEPEKPVEESPVASSVVNAAEPSSPEESAPRLTLKERLKLLEERQREEQAAAEALLKRKEEKKKKREEREKEKEHELKEAVTGDQNDESAPVESEQHQHTDEEEEETEKVPEEEDDDDDDDDDEEDEEEVKRRQLRERMAKLSGGMGMVGMMGFGAPMPVKEKTKKKEKQKEVEEPESVPRAAPIPIFPTATGKSVEPQHEELTELKDEETDDQSKYEPEVVDLTKSQAVDSEDEHEEEPAAPRSEHKPTASLPPVPGVPPVPSAPAVPDTPKTPTAPAVPAVPPVPTSHPSAQLTEPLESADLSSESDIDEDYKSVSTASPKTALSNPPLPHAPPVPVPGAVPSVPVPTAPPVAPAAMTDSSEEVVTGYEADDDTDIAQADRTLESPAVPHQVPPPLPSHPITKAPTTPASPMTAAPPPPPPAVRPAPPVPTSPIAPSAPRTLTTSTLEHHSTGPVHHPPPPPPPAAGIQAATTGSTIHSARKPSLDLSEVQHSSTHWWLTKDLPQELSSKDVYYEVDSHHINKRNGRKLVYLDYYIVNPDYSTRVWELSYDTAHPAKLASFNESVLEKPALNQTYLVEASKKYGALAFQLASSVIGTSKVQEDFVLWIYKQLPHDVMPSIASKTFGATIYRNTNNVDILQSDQLRPGDILVVLKGRFEGHSTGPFHKSKSAELGFNGRPYSAIVSGFDPAKSKIKVIEQSSKGIQTNSYKLGEFKSGKIRIFRIVGRDYFGW
ncbi:hypothetical protein OGAPHI_001403 [Ogataea philodendri]|uniref:SH3 domain-containing protein n=1 Tax=Ogataea philodendri TaxID=1378263 RepID=A0A9P8PDG7_9ASCO|nr:uncharacterized protein OGAPHI_001403 [Ogataea philodendri]KAH3669282.1 hypothetical protein OGAPHI_001403 [Ogataea philodendri]